MNSVVGRIQNVSAVILVLIFFAEPLPAFASVKVVDVLLSGTSWTVPSDWYSYDNSIEVIGAGGGGNYGQTDCCGGGGGAYAKIFNLALSPGASVTYQVGSPVEMEAREDISSKVVLKNALAAAAGRTGHMETLSVPATALGETDRGAMEVATEAAPPRALAAEEAAMIPTALTSAQPRLPRRSGAIPHRALLPALVERRWNVCCL